MNKRTCLLLTTLLLASLFTLANPGDKDKKQDPDLNGFVVAAETGKPIKDVSITAYCSSKKEKSVMSSASGSFSMADLKPGVYKFVFQKDGYEKVVREKMVLKTNEGYQLNIQMFEEENVFNLMPFPLHLANDE